MSVNGFGASCPPTLETIQTGERSRKKTSKKRKEKKIHAKTKQTLSGGGPGAVLSAGGSQHAARGGGGGCGAVVGVVIVGRRAWQDGVAVGWRAAELEPPQVLGVNRLVALQHFDGLVHCEPLPLAACGGVGEQWRASRASSRWKVQAKHGKAAFSCLARHKRQSVLAGVQTLLFSNTLY